MYDLISLSELSMFHNATALTHDLSRYQNTCKLLEWKNLGKYVEGFEKNTPKLVSS